MKHLYSDIEIAHDFVSAAPSHTNTAVLDRSTGRIYFLSALGDFDEDVPEDIHDNDAYVEIPHAHDIDLGRVLVGRFMSAHAPHLEDDVERMFKRKGAYARYKALLDDQGLLEAWYAYEASQTSVALRAWCAANNVDLVDEPPDEP